MDEKKRRELNGKIEEILDESFSVNSAWEKLEDLANKEGKEETFLTLLENIIDDLLENEKEVKNFLKGINWPMEETEGDKEEK
jgi:hypothetical protein